MSLKHLWEPSRHQHLTVLAAGASPHGGDGKLVADRMRTWIAANPSLDGPHWTSGIEVGIRLMSWAIVREFMAGDADVDALFDEADTARSVADHLQFLERFPSRGASVNNHRVAELAGRSVGLSAFLGESAWRPLAEVLGALTFDSGLGREQAMPYHRFVIELSICAWLFERDPGGQEALAALIVRQIDAAAAILDDPAHAVQQGDGDGAVGLRLDEHDGTWDNVLTVGRVLTGERQWYPGAVVDSATSRLVGHVMGARPLTTLDDRSHRRRSGVLDAGQLVFRSAPGIWVRFDVGPHGLAPSFAHAHDDRLSIDLSFRGQRIVTDPGSPSYGEDVSQRDRFRALEAHGTFAIGGDPRSRVRGTFMLTDPPSTRLVEAKTDRTGRLVLASARADGGGRSIGRTVRVDDRRVEIEDLAIGGETGEYVARFPLAPQVTAEIAPRRGIILEWSGGRAVLHIDDRLEPGIHPSGYSPSYGSVEPTSLIELRCSVAPGDRFVHTFEFEEPA